MALKKRTPVKPPSAPTATISTPTSKASEGDKKPIRRAVPPPSRRPIPPPVKKAEEPKEVKHDEAKQGQVIPPKKEEPKTGSHSATGESPKAPEPAISAGSDPAPAQSRPSHPREDKRLPIEAVREMEHDARYKLFKSLNHNPEKFVTLLKELPKQLQMRKDEALLRKIIEAKPPKVAKGLRVLYCPYCVDWQVFHDHSWSGYTKCTGCSISTKDFYIAADNGLFGQE